MVVVRTVAGLWRHRSGGWILALVACMAMCAEAGPVPDGGALPPPALRNADGEPMLRVVATTTQIADLARNVGGDLAHVDGILSANVDPRNFALSPGDLQRITWADVIVENGIGLERAWLGPLQRGKRVPVVVTNTRVRLLPGESTGTFPPSWQAFAIPVAIAGDGVAVLGRSAAMPDGDPHIWTAVPNAVRMVANIRDALSAAAPPYAGYYHANAARYSQQLWALDQEIVRQIAALPRAQRTLLVGSDAFRYYAARYGLGLVTLEAPRPDAPGSAGEIGAVAARIRAQHVKAIFVGPFLGQAVAEQVGREAGVRVVADLYDEALGLPGSDGDTYLKMMRHNTDVIVAALR